MEEPAHSGLFLSFFALIMKLILKREVVCFYEEELAFACG